MFFLQIKTTNRYKKNILLIYIMYTPIGIDKLSNAQISKLLRGQGVRVRHGSHHKIHVSTEQHKKIHKAHLKGAGVTLVLDPYQQQMHEEMRGCGVMSGLKKAVGHVKSAFGHAKTGLKHASSFYKEHKGTLEPYANILKKSASHKIERVAHRAQPHLTKHLGEFGSHLGHHAHSSAEEFVQGFGEEPLERPMHLSQEEVLAMSGEGLRHHKRKPVRRGGSLLGKLGKTVSQGVKGLSKQASAYAKSPEGRAMISKGLQYGADAAIMGLGVKRHPGRPRGRPRVHHGSALFAAGYGGSGMM